MMKERPILFSTAMVQAILQGRKTQTRRIIKAPRSERAAGFVICSQMDGSGKYPVAIDADERHLEGEINMPCPYGQVGDVLWVREKHRKLINCITEEESWSYYADMPEDFHQKHPHKWKPSLHMPKEACRLKLRITDIRVERLQAISNADVLKEGIEGTDGHWKDYLKGGVTTYRTNSFISLWESVNGEKSWNDNPWVWVIEFEKIN